jgi:hypothetical protein
MRESPPVHGVAVYDFEDSTWDQMCYYPSKAIGKAALKGEFEIYEIEEPEEKDEPANKKPRVEGGKTPDEIAKIRKGIYMFDFFLTNMYKYFFNDFFKETEKLKKNPSKWQIYFQIKSIFVLFVLIILEKHFFAKIL